jgi:hypothetical protein
MPKIRYYSTRYSVRYKGYTHYETITINIGSYNKEEALFKSMTLAQQYFNEKYKDDSLVVNFLSIFRLDHEPHRWNGMQKTTPVISKMAHRRTKV